MSTRLAEDMMLRPSQNKPFKTRSMTSSTVRSSKSKLKLNGRRRLAQLGLEHSEVRDDICCPLPTAVVDRGGTIRSQNSSFWVLYWRLQRAPFVDCSDDTTETLPWTVKPAQSEIVEPLRI